mgnify:CR=1 FL=1
MRGFSLLLSGEVAKPDTAAEALTTRIGPKPLMVVGPIFAAVGLFLLGLGWSFTLIAGSTLLTDDIGENERPAVQGLSDLVMNLAAALGGAVAGVIVATSTYGVLCLAALVPVLAIPVCAAWLTQTGRPAPGSP